MKIFKKENKRELKKPLVFLANKRMYATRDNGLYICTLVCFENCTFARGAKECLEGEGYSTDWASWDDEGRMVKLLEGFE